MATFTRQSFCQLLAIAIGYPGMPPLWLTDWLGGWSAHEIDVNQPYPAYNLFGCGEQWPGATNANSAGVKNYTSLGAGIQAMATNLNSGLFNPLVQALRAGDQNALTTAGGGVTQSLHNWRAGPNSTDFSGYESSIGGFILSGASHRGDTFTGPDASGGSSGGGAQTASSDCLAQCAPFAGNDLEYTTCLAICAGTPIVQSTATTVGQAGGALDAINNAFKWLGDRANWLRIAKIVGGVLLIITGLVLAIIAVSEKAASSPTGQKVISLASKAALA